MTKQQSIVLIQGSDIRGHWYEAACQNEATALYYLAQLAAGQDQELHHDTTAQFFQIGDHDYDLYTLELLDLDQVNELRKEHERCPTRAG